MGEQIRVPEGWKVEIRVRKTGRKDRYYVDPANGYIFRSLKDIDRYLLTGKLGRHVTKSKPKDLGSSDFNVDVQLPLKQLVSKEKKFLKPNGMKNKVKPHPDETKKKSCRAVREQKLAGNASKIEDGKAQNSNFISEKKISRSSNRRTPTSSRKKDSIPFFIRDPDQCILINLQLQIKTI